MSPPCVAFNGDCIFFFKEGASVAVHLDDESINSMVRSKYVLVSCNDRPFYSTAIHSAEQLFCRNDSNQLKPL
jgi:hypothetical protein